MAGTVVTFYSYKGGVGRSFALSNVACILSRWGFRVLCVDWDLDAPGLSYYFSDYLDGEPSEGVAGMVDRFAAEKDADPRDFVRPVRLPDLRGRLDLLPAGPETPRYVSVVQGFDWASLYRKENFGSFLERVKARWTSEYDFVLVDSRTGITDVGMICTAQLPDLLVTLFTASRQSVEGTVKAVTRAEEARDGLPYDVARLQVLPVPARFDDTEEHDRSVEWRGTFATQLARMFSSWLPVRMPVKELLNQVTIPYVSFWSFGERLAALGESRPGPRDISFSLQTIAALVAHRLDRVDLLGESRDAYVSAAARAGDRARRGNRYDFDVYLAFSPLDRPEASRVASLLRDEGLRVFLSDDLAVGESLSQLETALSRSGSLVLLVGARPGDRLQADAVERFLRQSLDDGSQRALIPMLLPGGQTENMPRLMWRLRYLECDTDEDLPRVAHQLAASVRESLHDD
jgi:MinD-like ATPase involved in chromosome partitioning or flagellar assembly